MYADSNAEAPHSKAFIVFLTVTSLACGALVMAVEILGSRVIGPFFGSSIFVWTSLITVTLVGLALGYSAGGVLSDRRNSPDYLYGIIFLAGVSVLLVPFLKRPVLEMTVSLGLRMGALTASTLLFGPALFLLGCVSPYIIKIAAREIRNIGRTVGLFSALSTVGSFIGTVCSGFILITYFRVNQIFAFIGAGLILLTVCYFVFFRKKQVSLLLLTIPFLMPGPAEMTSKVLQNGTTVAKLYDEDSYYGNLKVLEYSFRNNRLRELLLDGTVQGGMYMNTGMSVMEYHYYQQYIPFTLNPQGKRCLVIGLGMGAIPMWYEQNGITTDVVDINPEMFVVAEKFFGFKNSGEKIVEDARYFLSRSENKYDYVIFDVFSGENTPSHVLSIEALRLLPRRMNPGAILGVHLLGSLKKEARTVGSVVKTLQQIFTTVEIYPCTDAPDKEEHASIEIMAYNAPPIPLDRKLLQAYPFPAKGRAVRERIGTRYTPPLDRRAIVLTDNYNPIDSWDLEVKEGLRKTAMEYTDLDMLL